MMPGVGFIGGKLSILGGYSWPGAVDIIEQWDEDRLDLLILIVLSNSFFSSSFSLSLISGELARML